MIILTSVLKIFLDVESGIVFIYFRKLDMRLSYLNCKGVRLKIKSIFFQINTNDSNSIFIIENMKIKSTHITHMCNSYYFIAFSITRSRAQ